jgi:hypothetical protein
VPLKTPEVPVACQFCSRPQANVDIHRLFNPECRRVSMIVWGSSENRFLGRQNNPILAASMVKLPAIA